MFKRLLSLTIISGLMVSSLTMCFAQTSNPVGKKTQLYPIVFLNNRRLYGQEGNDCASKGSALWLEWQTWNDRYEEISQSYQERINFYDEFRIKQKEHSEARKKAEEAMEKLLMEKEQRLSSLNKDYPNFAEKLRLVASNIAKKYGALAAFDSSSAFVLTDTRYDITDEVVTRLNEEYLTRKK